MFSFEDIYTASDRISRIIHKTPVITSSYIDSLCDMKVYFKCEHLQKTGSFKARGALNAVFPLSANHTFLDSMINSLKIIPKFQQNRTFGSKWSAGM